MNVNELEQTLQSMGIAQEEINEVLIAQDQQNEDMPLIQPGNVLTVYFFNKVQRYWHRVGMEATPCYLDIAMIEARARKISWYRQLSNEASELLWEGMDILEHAFLATYNTMKARQ